MTNLLVHVTTESGTVINTTENHPFYVENKGWVAAINLENGDILHTKEGQIEIVTDVFVKKQEKPVKVYNLTIEDYHTYYVSKNNVLVHWTIVKRVDTFFVICRYSIIMRNMVKKWGLQILSNICKGRSLYVKSKRCKKERSRWIYRRSNKIYQEWLIYRFSTRQ